MNLQTIAIELTKKKQKKLQHRENTYKSHRHSLCKNTGKREKKMSLVDAGTSAILVSRDNYLQAKEQAALLAFEGKRVLVFCDEAVMNRWMASLEAHQELQQKLRCTP